MLDRRHAAEPWIAVGRGVFEQGGTRLASTTQMEASRRIVACVNACWGIPTEVLERGALRDFLAVCWTALPEHLRPLLVELRPKVFSSSTEEPATSSSPSDKVRLVSLRASRSGERFGQEGWPEVAKA